MADRQTRQIEGQIETHDLGADCLPRLIKNLIDKLGSRSTHALAVRVRSFVIDGLSEDRRILTQNVRGRDAGCFATRDLSEANRWIYGDGAFGLRLAAWIARRRPDVPVDATDSCSCFACDRSPAPFCRPNEIAEMADATLARSVSISKEA